MPVDNSVLEFQATFGIETFLTQLFPPIDPIAELNRAPHPPDDLVLVLLATAARRTSDVLIPRELTDEVRAATHRTLFHERVHYWQVMSTSAIQRQIVNSLTYLQKVIECDGGNKLAAWGGPAPDSSTMLLDAQYLYMNLNWEKLDVYQTFETLSLRGGPPTSLTRLHFGWDLLNLVEGYVADLGFEGNSNSVRVPFVGRYLLESAAYVSEQLYNGELPDRMPPHPTPEDILYRGAWEVWARVNTPRYADATALATSFLAAVDLALNPELPPYPENARQRGIVPWRFGILLVAAPQLPALDLSATSAASAATQFQERYCQSLGWSSPNTIALQMAINLLKRYVPLFGLSKHADQVDAFYNRNNSEITVEDLTPILQIINEGGEPDIIGLQILRSLINAALYRLHHPGTFALPHVYAEELIANFPLPAILYGGEFYLDSFGQERQPLQIDLLGYWSDCVRLMTIDHLRTTPPSEKLTCGFVQRRVECPYTVLGAGCPKRGLSPAQRDARNRTGLVDWCHWKLTAMGVGLIPWDADKDNAPAALRAATAMSLILDPALLDPDMWEKLLKGYDDLWDRMSDQDREAAIAGSAEMRKTLPMNTGAAYLDLWSLVAARAAARHSDANLRVSA